MFRLRYRLTVVLLTLASLAVVLVTTGLSRTASPAVAATSTTDVVFVHGAGCGAINYTYYAMKFQAAATGEPMSKLHTVAYYNCDTYGDSIVNEGSPNYLPSTDQNGMNTEIDRVAYELAWYLWNNFGSKGLPVDLVGHSMGGVIIADALQHIVEQDPAFPPSLDVPSVITFSAPMGGVSASFCALAPSEECTELTEGSPLLAGIDAAGAPKPGGTVWVAVGSDGSDPIPSSSSLALPGATWRIDYTSPAYTHTGYLTDASWALNAHGTVNGIPFSTGYHSLLMMAELLR